MLDYRLQQVITVARALRDALRSNATSRHHNRPPAASNAMHRGRLPRAQLRKWSLPETLDAQSPPGNDRSSSQTSDNPRTQGGDQGGEQARPHSRLSPRSQTRRAWLMSFLPYGQMDSRTSKRKYGRRMATAESRGCSPPSTKSGAEETRYDTGTIRVALDNAGRQVRESSLRLQGAACD